MVLIGFGLVLVITSLIEVMSGPYRSVKSTERTSVLQPQAIEAHDSSRLPQVERLIRHQEAALVATHMLRHYLCEPVAMPKSIMGLSTQLMLAHAYNHASIWQHFMLEVQRWQSTQTPLSPWCPSSCSTAMATSVLQPWPRCHWRRGPA